jgi:nickel-dependent lactate racemase
MVDCWLPYGDTEVYISVELASLLGLAEPKQVEPDKTPIEIITGRFMESSGKTLEESLKPGNDVVIAVDIYSNPHAITQVLVELVKLLVELIVPKENISIILGNGELDKENIVMKNTISKVDELRNIKLIDHNRGTSNYVNLGQTHQRTTIEINRRYSEARTKIAVGETRIDPLTGYAGAHSAVVPGLASIETIKNYRKKYLDTNTTPGVIELNPIKEDVIEAVNQVGIDYALNIITNKEGRLIDLQCGEYKESWGKAINSLSDQYEISTEGGADIVVVSAGGGQYDQTLYQSVWALYNASKVTKKNGVIILLAQCMSGLGADAFSQLASVSDSNEIKRRYMYGAEALDLLRRIQKDNRVILVSALPNYLIEALGLEVARTTNEAYQRVIQSRRGRKTIIIPYGSQSVLTI